MSVTWKDMLPLLVAAELVYRSGRSPSEIRALAKIFARVLEKDNLASIKAAFALHVERSIYFPTPADIAAVLPETRVAMQAAALPEPEGKITPGLGKKVCERIRLRLRQGRARPLSLDLEELFGRLQTE